MVRIITPTWGGIWWSGGDEWRPISGKFTRSDKVSLSQVFEDIPELAGNKGIGVISDPTNNRFILIQIWSVLHRDDGVD